MPHTFITHKITPEARRLLRLIAAQTGETQTVVLERVLTQEWSRVQPAPRPKES